MSLVLAVLLAHAAHEGPRLTRLLQADKLDGVDLVLRAQGLLVGLVRQRHPPVFGQRARGVRELRALAAQVGGAHGAVHGGRVALVLVTADDALAGKGKNKGGGCRTRAGLVKKRVMPAKGAVLTSPMPFRASSATPDWLVAPFWRRSRSSSRAKFFFRPQTPESPERKRKKSNINMRSVKK